MKSAAKTVKEYLASLPADRRAALDAVRAVILKNLPKGYEEGMQYGMIGYYVPHGLYPAGYHCDSSQPLPFAGLASQKNHMALYLMCMYIGTEEDQQFRAEWAATGKKLDMGKSCLRFKSVDDLALPVIGRAIKRIKVKTFIERYESVIKPGGKRAAPRAAKKTSVGKAAVNKNRVKKKTTSAPRKKTAAGRASKTPRKKTARKMK